MSESLSSCIEAMDRCWMERRYDDLASYIAEDVVMVAPGGQGRIAGLGPAIQSYRDFMARSHVRHYKTSGHIMTERGDAAVAEYAWDMAWESDGSLHEASGREVLVLAHRDEAWRVIWRTQLPA